MDTLIGTSSEVGRQLTETKADHVIAVILDPMNSQVVDVFADAIAEFVRIFKAIPMEAEAHAASRTTNIKTRDTAELTQHIELTELLMRVKSRIAVLGGTQWLSAGELAELVGLPNEVSATLLRWQQQNRIFSIQLCGVTYFPRYALDAAKGYQPFAAMIPIIQALSKKRDGWGIASWFLGATADHVRRICSPQNPNALSLRRVRIVGAWSTVNALLWLSQQIGVKDRTMALTQP